MVYGYTRISTRKQSLKRQVENILRYDGNAKIIEEVFTGTSTARKEWQKLKRRLKADDTVIFDSVSRMSRDAKEGIKEYEKLLEKEVNLVFLKEAYINTEVYQSQLEGYKNIDTDNADLQPMFQGIKDTLKNLARRQIVIAFEQSEKEVKDLSQRTKEALAVKKAEGKQLGQLKGAKLVTKKSLIMKDKIKKMSKKFEGSMLDKEVMETLGIARNTYYKYTKEMMSEGA
jgi:DNA invertase Pin-like site-specific DNA recombinase